MHLPTPPMSMTTPRVWATIPRLRSAGSSLFLATPSATSVRDNHQVTVEFVELLNKERERKIEANLLNYFTILNNSQQKKRSLLLSWEVAMSVFLVLVVVLSIARLDGTGARKTRRTRTSDSVVGFMQQRPSRLLGIYQQREKGMAFDVLPLS